MDFLKKEAVYDFFERRVHMFPRSYHERFLAHRDKLLEAFSMLPDPNTFSEPMYFVPVPLSLDIEMHPNPTPPEVKFQMWTFVQTRWVCGDLVKREWVLQL